MGVGGRVLLVCIFTGCGSTDRSAIGEGSNVGNFGVSPLMLPSNGSRRCRG